MNYDDHIKPSANVKEAILLTYHVHDDYGKEMAPSSDVNDTDEDKDEDESNNSIVHDLFDEPSAENLIMEERESECNIIIIQFRSNV